MFTFKIFRNLNKTKKNCLIKANHKLIFGNFFSDKFFCWIILLDKFKLLTKMNKN